MSENNGVETAYERGRRHGETGTGPGSSGGGGNFLSKNLGPLPIWAWGAVILVLTIIFYMWSKNKNANNTNSSSAQTASTGTTNSSLVPQFVNQVYTQGSPPSAHNWKHKSPSGGTTPSAPTESGTPVVMSLPNGSGGWEQVQFPNQAAVDAWTAWNQAFVNDNNAQAYRSQWNTELTSLGVTGQTNGQPLTPPSTTSSNPYDRL